MAASLLRIGRLGCVKCLQAGSWSILSRAPAAVAFSTKSGGSKKPSQKSRLDKKQTKTYFDIEKLVQHKPYEIGPATAAAVKPAAEPLPSAVSPEVVETIPVLESSSPVVEATPAAEAEAAPIPEVPPAIETVSQPATAVGPVPIEAASVVPTVAEAVPVVKAVPAASPPPEDFAKATVPAIESLNPSAKCPAEAFAVKAAPAPEALLAEPPVEVAPEASAVETAAVVEAAPEIVLVQLSPAVAAPEAVAEAAPAVAAPEAVAEAAPAVAAPEAVAEAAPAVAAPVESIEELVDRAPVIAEAAGEELQAEGPAESVESEAHMDPVQKLFLDSIRKYSTKSQATGGLVDAGSEYEKALAEETAKLQRLYGGGDLTSFPEFKFTEAKLDEVSQK